MRKRPPRRKVVDVKIECTTVGPYRVTVTYCVLDCGHEVVGTGGRSGRRTCRQCAEGVRDA